MPASHFTSEDRKRLKQLDICSEKLEKLDKLEWCSEQIRKRVDAIYGFGNKVLWLLVSSVILSLLTLILKFNQ